jgi:hypothetical protein
MRDGQGDHHPASDASGLRASETIMLRDMPDGLAPIKRPINVDRDLQHIETLQGKHPGDRYLRVSRHRDFQRVRAGYLIPREIVDGKRRHGHPIVGLKRLLLGRPLATAEESEERVNRFVGLAIFASDNISSSAYATEEIMRVLLLAGVGALALTLPITLVICVVLAIVVLSYQQVIRAYPNGGGSYVVAKDNLGPLAGLAAGAALLTDYILTVSVSTAAGVAAITSAFPDLVEQRVTIMLVVVAFMTLMNLRGIRESGRAFAVPVRWPSIALTPSGCSRMPARSKGWACC